MLQYWCIFKESVYVLWSAEGLKAKIANSFIY